jgi:transposase-like protein
MPEPQVTRDENHKHKWAISITHNCPNCGRDIEVCTSYGCMAYRCPTCKKEYVLEFVRASGAIQQRLVYRGK